MSVLNLLYNIINEIQDAYALCRVFKKTGVITTKIGEQYVNSSHVNANHQIMGSDQSSSIELYSEGRTEDLETSNYLNMPLHHNNINVANACASAQRDEGNFSHLMSQHPFSLSNSSSSFPNYASIPYPPSKVNSFI